jgi:uncharacterized protein YlbG (UPF0298 family)
MKINNSNISQSDFIKVLKDHKSKNLFLYLSFNPVEVTVKEINGNVVKKYIIQEPVSDSFFSKLESTCKNKTTLTLQEFTTLYDQTPKNYSIGNLDPKANFYPSVIKEYMLMPVFNLTPEEKQHERALHHFVKIQSSNFPQLTQTYENLLYKSSTDKQKETILFRVEVTSIT